MYFDLVQKEIKCTARLVAPAAIDWLSQRSTNRVLHVFQNSCNLINLTGSILSLVSTEIGPGPFAITVEMMGLPDGAMTRIWDDVTVLSRVQISPEQIQIATVHIDLTVAEIWNPRPAWEAIVSCNWGQARQVLLEVLYSNFPSSNAFIIANHGQLSAFAPKIVSAWRELSAGLQENDIDKAKAGAVKMAGLGSGLTPAGDDFLMGFIYSLWSRWDSERAHDWATELVKGAVPLTTRLSTAWLKAAANGEAAQPWHQLVNALIKNEPGNLKDATAGILATGHSSGSDALTGYVAGLTALSRVPSF